MARSAEQDGSAEADKEPASSASADSTERQRAIEKMLALFCAAYDREPPDALERRLKVGVWAMVLEAVPTSELLPLAKRELAERESAFFPVPADLLRRWRASQRFTPEGAANAAAYMPYRPTPHRPALCEALPPLQIEPEELKRRLGLPVSRRAPTSEALDASETTGETNGDVPQASEQWSPLLLEVARAGNIALELCSPAQIAELRAFGRWWLANHPKLDLSCANFAATYQQFCQRPKPERKDFEQR